MAERTYGRDSNAPFDPNWNKNNGYDWTPDPNPGRPPDPNAGKTPGGHNAVFAPLYNTDFQKEAYLQWLDQLPGGRDSVFAKYAAAQYSPALAIYMKATETQPDLNWQDYLSPELQQHLQTQFGLQSAAQRGEQWGPNQWAGRWVG